MMSQDPCNIPAKAFYYISFPCSFRECSGLSDTKDNSIH